MELAASTSSGSSPMPPSLRPAGEYEVFLSFRGPDVRNTFADHLYTFLSSRKIRTFRDNEELPKGEEISPVLVRAIGESKIYIPILTEQYASSKWCLQELAHMVECSKQGKGHLILPIFYFVDPREVRNQQGPYKQAFEQHAQSQKHSPQTVEEWKEALDVVGKMKGWHVTESDGQGAVIDRVVSEVEVHLRSNYNLVTDELVGIDTRVEEVVKLLNLGLDNPKVIGIHGMGGIGKTTLSKAVFDKISAKFDRCCFLKNVRETLSRNDGDISLQNKFISSILRHDYHVKLVSDGINLIKDIVCKHKVLLVLDDVDAKFEFDQILGKLSNFSLESRFIFTTRNKKVFKFLAGCELYEVGEMGGHYSLQLFSKHAFGTDHPPEDYATLTKEFIKVAAGLPLALKVFGSLLFHEEREFWEEKLKELRGIPSSNENDVLKSLKISYNELTNSEKQIFLDIACCFIGGYKELSCYMWSDCNFFPVCGINTLVLRSLMKLEGNQFRMHDLLRDLGRAIVKEEGIQHPYKCSSMWSNEDALKLVESEEGNDRVEVLNISMLGEDAITDKMFKKLSRLRYLKVYGRVTGNFSKILPNLRFLCLSWCPSIPTELNMKKLTVLDLHGSGVEDDWKGWNGIQAAHQLKVIDLQKCLKLKRAPDLSRCVSLESIDVEGCSRQMIGGLHIGNSKKLKTLKLSNTKIEELTGDIGMLQDLQEIYAVRTNLTKLPVGMDKLSSLKILQLESCWLNDRIMEVPRLPTSLNRLSISSLGGIPNLLELKDLEHLTLWKPQIPGDLWKLSNLKELTLVGSPRDETQETTSAAAAAALPSSLTHLRTTGLMRLPNLANLKRLTELTLKQFGAHEIRGLGELSALERMEIFSAPNLRKLDGLENLLLLTHLEVRFCSMLEKMPSLANLIKLQSLEIMDCEKLKEVTGLGRLVSLESLSIKNCTWLKALLIEECTELIGVTGSQRLEKLGDLIISGCTSIKKLGDLSSLKNLVHLDVSECIKLGDVTGMERLQSLEKLHMSGCRSIKELGNLSGLKNLRELDIRGCTQLTQVKGIEELEHLTVLSSLEELEHFNGPAQGQEAENC